MSAEAAARGGGARGRTLVTGAGGFIGSHLVEALARRGSEVRALVRYGSRGSWGWLDHIPAEARAAVEVVSGDVRDPGCARRAVRGCERVFHLAALIGIPYSYEAPDAYVAVNVAGTLNLLEAARDAGVARFLQTSTSEVYGTARSVPITEDHPLHAQSPYAATKIAADQLALSFHASFGLPVVVARPFNTYGPRQSTRAVLPTIIAQLAAGRREVRLGSTRPTRDFCFVADTAAGMIALAEAEGAVGEVLNLGTGEEISVGDAARLAAEVMGVEAAIVTDEGRVRPAASEVERLCADAGKAARIAGWRPAYAGRDGLRRGLAETIAWFRDPENLARYRPDAYAV